MKFSEFISLFSGRPIVLISAILITGVVLVNGWTDAPTAIASCISSKAMKPKKAIALAAVMNFAGVFVMSKINGSVAFTIFNMVDFGNDAEKAQGALCAALCSIVIWAVAAWFFGIPTSESHALIAGLTGSALAINKSFTGINFSEWVKVIYGLVLSTVLGFFLGFITAKIVRFLIKNSDREKYDPLFTFLQNISAAAMAFMHGAQDGQKFIGVFMLAASLSQGKTDLTVFSIPLWLIAFCSLTMAAGTSAGGMKIIKSMGMDMVKLKKYQGFSADTAGALCLLVSTLTGLPVSTTHTKTTAIMGVGAAKRMSSVDWKIVKEMVLTWILTFPGCGFLGYLISVLFMG